MPAIVVRGYEAPLRFWCEADGAVWELQPCVHADEFNTRFGMKRAILKSKPHPSALICHGYFSSAAG